MVYTVVVDLLCALLHVMCHMTCPSCALRPLVLAITAVASDDVLLWQSWSAFVYPDPAGCVTVILISVMGWSIQGQSVGAISPVLCSVDTTHWHPAKPPGPPADMGSAPNFYNFCLLKSSVHDFFIVVIRTVALHLCYTIVVRRKVALRP